MSSFESSFQNLAESISLVVFGYVRSYILIDHQDLRTSLYIIYDLSLFDYWRNFS